MSNEMSEVNKEKSKVCPNCGGMMQFNISKQKIVCVNCNSELDYIPTKTKILEHDFKTNQIDKNDSIWQNSVEYFKCSSCGAEITVSSTTKSSTCPYCGSNHLVESKNISNMPPEGLILFKIDKQKALYIFTNWIKGRFFAPNELKTLVQQDKFFPIYSPFWTFDADTFAEYTGQGGIRRYINVQEDGKTVTKVDIDWYFTNGIVRRNFDDVLVYAGKENKKLINKMNYNTINDLTPFDNSFLSGFSSETYTISKEEALINAKSIMEYSLRNDATNDILGKYDEAIVSTINVEYNNIKFKHILLPIWCSGFTYKNQKYTITINGVTGEIYGTYPKSTIKIILAVIFALIVVCIIYYIFMKMEGQ